MLFMIPPEIKSGPTDIIASGTVISFKKNPIEIIFGSVNTPLKLIIEFETDDENEESQDVLSNPSKDTLILKLINHNNPLGSGNTEPVYFGTIEGRGLYLNYRVYTLLAELDKTVHYAIYLGEEVVT